MAVLVPHAKRRFYPIIKLWAGERPDVRESKLIQEIAAKIDYPLLDNVSMNRDNLYSVTRCQAAEIMAKCTHGLAYPRKVRASTLADMKIALSRFHDDAAFLTNLKLEDNGFDYAMRNFSEATFDGGVIGFDNRNAFIFWVEDED